MRYLLVALRSAILGVGVVLIAHGVTDDRLLYVAFGGLVLGSYTAQMSRAA